MTTLVAQAVGHFMEDYDGRSLPWIKPVGAPTAFETDRILFGNGDNALEVAIASAVRPGQPKAEDLRALFKKRQANRPAPVLLAVTYTDSTGKSLTSVTGTTGDPAPVSGLSLDRVARICAAILAEPDRHAAARAAQRLLNGLKDQLTPGLVNSGLFASHELRIGVPARPDWGIARKAALPMLGLHGLPLIHALGYDTAPRGSTALLLTHDGHWRAVAVLLNETETFDRPSARFGAVSPIAHGLSVAAREELPWLVVLRGTQIRLYPAKSDVGVGRKGQAETYTELDLALLSDDDAAYLTFLFAPTALDPGGTADQIIATSENFAADLGNRLRKRVYEDVVPRLALAVAARMSAQSDEDLNEAYHRTLLILFRLLFLAYAEDRGLLPYGRNPRYDRHAVKTLARDFAAEQEFVFDQGATSLWDDMLTVWAAVDEGNTGWDVPAYNGGLFSRDPATSPAGAALADLHLTDAEFGPALRAMLVDLGEDGTQGPVDFRSLGVREFGTIYEGLLESDLSISQTDLTVDTKGSYLPARDGDVVVVPRGGVYIHNKSGQRKSTGSYFTKQFAVERLLDTAIEPAIDAHLNRIRALLDEEDEAAAADAFFDFRVADLAMGSAHFLVAAIDRIEKKFTSFLTERGIPAVTDELTRLSQSAARALGEHVAQVEIETGSLLRRQIARRCIYGLDLNQMAVELARLAIWIHTFIPGLPMSALNHGLVQGNSLTGIATIDDVLGILDPDHDPNRPSLFHGPLTDALAVARARLLRVARTAEATKQEVRDASKAYREAQKEAAVAQALCDAALAVRLGLLGYPPLDPESALAVAGRADVRKVLDELQVVHLPVLFPEVFLREQGGFDVILGNPPWDKVRHEPTQFWVVRDPGLNALPALRREARIEELRIENPVEAASEEREAAQREMIKKVAKTCYRLQGSQHHEYSKMFMERFLAVLGIDGSLGVVLPHSALLVSGWARVRDKLVCNADLAVVECRNSGFWLFDMDNRKMVALVARRHSPSSGKIVIHPRVQSYAEFNAIKSDPGIVLSEDELRSMSEDAVIPWFASNRDALVFNRMREHPSFGSGNGWISGRADSTRWDFSGSGRHAQFVSTADRPGSWRVLMTRHVDAYKITSDRFQRFIHYPAALTAENRGVEIVDGAPQLSGHHPAIVYRFPTNNDNSRTLIATVLPASGFLYSKGYVHGVSLNGDASTRDTLALLGYFNSIAADWWSRRFVDRHLGLRIIIGLPLPDWTAEQRQQVADRVEELIVRHGVSELPGGRKIGKRRPLKDIEEMIIRAELDNLVFAAFELGRGDVQIVFADFKDTEEALPLQYRHAVLDLMEVS